MQADSAQTSQRYTAPDEIKQLSRPGSAYVRVAHDPLRPPTAHQARDTQGRAVGGYLQMTSAANRSVLPTSASAGPVDPLAEEEHAVSSLGSTMQRKLSLKSLSL